MIQEIFNQGTYAASKQLLDASVVRHEALASNMANIETPGYKRVDVSPTFESQLQQAVASRDPDQISGVQPQLAVDSHAISGRSDGTTMRQ